METLFLQLGFSWLRCGIKDNELRSAKWQLDAQEIPLKTRSFKFGTQILMYKASSPELTPLMVRVLEQVSEFLLGQRDDFDLNIRLDSFGTQFQNRVWNALLRVPKGQVVSYSDIARQVGSPHSVRAVGSANSKNPLCLFVPCHRVIKKDGDIGGYVGGPNQKSWLLKVEADQVLGKK